MTDQEILEVLFMLRSALVDQSYFDEPKMTRVYRWLKRRGIEVDTILLDERSNELCMAEVCNACINSLKQKPRERIDWDRLREEIRMMSSRSAIYGVLKSELSLRGWWKNRARGKPGNPNSSR